MCGCQAGGQHVRCRVQQPRMRLGLRWHVLPGRMRAGMGRWHLRRPVQYGRVRLRWRRLLRHFKLRDVPRRWHVRHGVQRDELRGLRTTDADGYVDPSVAIRGVVDVLSDA